MPFDAPRLILAQLRRKGEGNRAQIAGFGRAEHIGELDGEQPRPFIGIEGVHFRGREQRDCAALKGQPPVGDAIFARAVQDDFQLVAVVAVQQRGRGNVVIFNGERVVAQQAALLAARGLRERLALFGTDQADSVDAHGGGRILSRKKMRYSRMLEVM